MDITSGIARISMEMASTKVAAEVQTSVLKNAMNVQQETISLLLESMGMGQKLNVRG